MLMAGTLVPLATQLLPLLLPPDPCRGAACEAMHVRQATPGRLGALQNEYGV
jgi:hypothetical protein